MMSSSISTRSYLSFEEPSNSNSTCQPDDDDDDDDEEEEEEEEEDNDSVNALEHTIFRVYLQVSGGSNPDLSKIRDFLISSRHGAAACLICLERIRPTDSVWSCSSSCYAIFHLICVQTWARQASYIASERAAARLLPISSNTSVDSFPWHCPKCRLEYPYSLIPRSYFCFCGKIEQPPVDPWVLPHSCGEVCNRPLRGSCEHRCLLLCHPGPCPPCPKLITVSCFCGSVEEVRRCALKKFSCNNQCRHMLACGIHRCQEKCHQGSCPPCHEKVICRCQCGNKEEERKCNNSEFQCEKICNGLLDCKKHVCSRGCHAGFCGTCPLKGKRSCPCGKMKHDVKSCDEVVPSCGLTCEKVLNCGIHRCPERCHRGSCIETCRTIILKSCRCESLKKEIPCCQDLQCERKCQRVRDCGRHACKRRCCDGNCPPCPEICGRKLRCKNHKCPSPCHRGPCAPCPLMVSISCYCGETRFQVPCGMESGQKPARCSKPCPIPRLCGHKMKCKAHRCHYGPCPPCSLICEEEFPCGHKCKQRCHGPKPAPNPEFTLKPKKNGSERSSKPTPGKQCPPCQEPILRPCLGNHLGAERVMLCSDKSLFACENLCGNLLQCGNHYCQKPCHVLKDWSSMKEEGENKNLPWNEFILDAARKRLSESCDECLLSCQKESSCPHACSLRCHTGDCPTCKVLIKRYCHCGSMACVFECNYFTGLSEEQKQNVCSCGGPCHRKLPNCTHLCPDTCHPGDCPSIKNCLKKVTVRCSCKCLKKEWLCRDVQIAYYNAGLDSEDIPKNRFGQGILPCDAECFSKLMVKDIELKHRTTKETELNIQLNDPVQVPRRRKRYQRRQEETERQSNLKVTFLTIRRYLVCASILLGLAVVSYYSYKGLLWLSDRMNEMEVKRTRRVRRL